MKQKIIIGISILVGIILIGISTYFIVDYVKKPTSSSEYVYANLRTVKNDEKTPVIISDDDYITVFVDTNLEREIKVEYKTDFNETIIETGKSVRGDDGLITLPVKLKRLDNNYKVLEFKVYYLEDIIYEASFPFLVTKKKAEVIEPVVEKLDIVSFNDKAEITFKPYVKGEFKNNVNYQYKLFKDEKEIDTKDIISVKMGVLTVNKVLLEEGEYKIEINAENENAIGNVVETFEVNIKSLFTDFNLRVDGFYKFGDKDVNFELSFKATEFQNVEILEVFGNEKVIIDEVKYDNITFEYTLKCHISILEAKEEMTLDINEIKVKVTENAPELSIKDLSLTRNIIFSKPSFENIVVENAPFYLVGENTNILIELFLNSKEEIILKSVTYDFGKVNYGLLFSKGKVSYNVDILAKDNGFKILSFEIEYNGMTLNINIPENKQDITYKVINIPKILDIKTNFNINDDKKYLEILFDENLSGFKSLNYKLKDINTEKLITGMQLVVDTNNNTVKIDVTELFSEFGGKSSKVKALFEEFQLIFETYEGINRLVVPDNIINNILTLRNSDVISEVEGVEKLDDKIRIRTVFNEAFEMPKDIKVNISYFNNISGEEIELEMTFNVLEVKDGYLTIDTSSVLSNYKGKIKVNYIITDNTQFSNFIGIGQIFNI